MKDYLVFNGINSLDYGVEIFPKEIDKAPRRDIEIIAIPGRNGSLIIDNGRYEDAEQSYTGIIYNNSKFDEYMDAMRSLILSESGYKRLEDTFKPDEYRMAYIDEDFSPNVVRLWRKMGKFELKFTCKPQRYLKLGDNVINFENAGSLINPSVFPAQPMIRVLGYGNLTIGDYQIEITEHTLPHIDIDCERMDAYSGNVNCNSIISLDSDFPVLGAGVSEISFDNTIAFVQITPKWWRL